MTEEPVLKLLQDEGIVYKVSGRDYVVKCLNPSHEDSNPSCRIDRITGATHCFSCGWKTNIFRHFGILEIPKSVKLFKLKEKLNQLNTLEKELALPKGASPYNESFRGINHKTLKEFGAFYTFDVEELNQRIIFPIKNVLDKTVAYIARHTLSNSNPRYVVFPRHVQLPLYPVKFNNETKIILVEGIFDLLNLYDKGIKNVVCAFGTSTLKSDLKHKVLPLKAQGISKIYIMFDGDTPGRTAAEELRPLLENEGFFVEVINLPDEMDPGNLNQEYVDSIKEYING
ncbi:MAG TPA: toprim domain-containing protein [Allocoleopsis sp.]